MFSPKFTERIKRLIRVQLAERCKQIPFEISKVTRENNANGGLNSSRTILQYKEICEREIEIRAVIVWQSLVRVINTLSNEKYDNLSQDLKDFMEENINLNFEELTRLLNQNLRNLMKPEQVEMTQTRDHVISKHEIEIDLFVDTLDEDLRKEDNITKRGDKNNYHFYGNVNSVQTGANAIANVVQNLASEDQEAIKQALVLANNAINAATNISTIQKNELIDITSEVSNELEKENPNSTKLKSMFLTIGTTIQTLASAKPAYQALKGALIPLGIMLP